MNEKVNKFLLAKDEFMTEMHLRQHWFTYSVCKNYSLKTKKEYKNLKK